MSNPIKIEPETHVSCVSGWIIHSGKYLLIRRCGKYLAGTWQPVTGGVHEGETAKEAALREIMEETGIAPDRFYVGDAVEQFYYEPMDKIVFCPVYVAIIEEPREVVLSPREHDAYEWVTFDEAMGRLVFAEQRRVLQHIHENFVLRSPNPIFSVFSN